MSKYSRKKQCRCCKQGFDQLSKIRICDPCEKHVYAQRSGPGIRFVFPKKCPGPHSSN